MTHLLQIHEPGQTPTPHPPSPDGFGKTSEGEVEVAVGIDLGTTHSVVAFARNDTSQEASSPEQRPMDESVDEAGGNQKVEVLHDPNGVALIPSAVSYADGRVVVGAAAKQRFAEGDNESVISIKRFMGRGAEDVAEFNLPYELSKDEGMVKLQLGDRQLSPVQISADILRHLKHMAEQALNQKVSKTVITVPAYFDDAARQATKDAAKLAGLDVLRLVNEPTAAALAYGLDEQPEGVYAIYDFGGGTFDISILRLEKGVFQVVATAGDIALGGDDIDREITKYIYPPACGGDGGEENNTSPLNPPVNGGTIYNELLAIAREIKERLTEEESVIVEIDGTRHVFTRADLEKVAVPIINKTLEVCKQALADAELAVDDLDGVVLVGGSTHMPLVRQKVQAFFGKTTYAKVDPDKVVAIGAALQAKALTQGSDNLLLDVVPLSLGLETMGGLVEKIIERNTPIPVCKAQEFTTYQDGQTGMQIHVLQGEREMVEHNRSLAKFELTGIPPLPAGIARVEVVFAVDADGLLTVSAKEKTTGIVQQIEVKPSYGISEEEMKQMLLSSMEHARDDIMQRLLVEAKVNAKRAVIELESAMNQDADLVDEATGKLIKAQIGYINEAVEEGDRERIDMEVGQLGVVAQAFAEKRMNQAIEKALAGKSIDEVSS